MFQIVHQAQELWLKLLNEEGIHLVADLERDDLWTASGRLERMARIQRCLGAEMDVLFNPRAARVPDHPAQPRDGQRPRVSWLQPPHAGSIARDRRRDQAPAASVARSRSRTFMPRRRRRPTSSGSVSSSFNLDQAFQEWLVRHFLCTAHDRSRTHRARSRRLSHQCARGADGATALPLAVGGPRGADESVATGGGHPVGADRKKPRTAG